MSTQAPFIRNYYHCDNSNPLVRNPVAVTSKHIGIELEVVGVNHYQALLSSIPHPTKKEHRPLTEEDASLPDSRGLEIIFPPFSASSLKNKRGYFAKVLEAIKPSVINNHYSAGMHLNVAKLETDIANAIFMALLHNLPNAVRLAMFKRLDTRYSEQVRYGFLREYSPYIDNDLLSNHNIAATYRGRHSYNAAERVIKYIEVRMARSEVEHDDVVRIIKFLELVREFAESDNTGVSLDTRPSRVYRIFKDWLATKSKKSKRARTMLKFLN